MKRQREILKQIEAACKARGLTLSRWRANGRRGVHNVTTYAAHTGNRPARSEEASRNGLGIRIPDGVGRDRSMVLLHLLRRVEEVPIGLLCGIAPAAVFVYGTLLRGLHNERVLPAQAEERRVPATMPGIMYSRGGFPMCDFHSSPNGSPPIKGEVVFLKAD